MAGLTIVQYSLIFFAIIIFIIEIIAIIEVSKSKQKSLCEKILWILFILCIPLIGLMSYFLLSDRNDYSSEKYPV